MKFIYHTDPGHGWLEVPKSLIGKFGLTFSRYSYWDQNNFYLEEDCDAAKFLDYLTKNKIGYVIEEKYAENCFVRGLRRVGA